MRLFIAVRLEKNVKNALTAAQTALRKSGVKGNYTPEANLHLTLAFIGEYGDPDKVIDAMDTVRFEPFALRADGFGCFGDLWWAGIEPSEELTSYVRRLRRALSDADIPFDGKKFSPHITLLRRAEGSLAAPPVISAGMTVESVSLMRSDRGRNGMVYTEIGAVSAEENITED